MTLVVNRFVNVELCGTKPQAGATGLQATVLLENPKGDFPLSVHGLTRQVKFVFYMHVSSSPGLAGVAFSTAVRGGVRYSALSAIQICRCPHSTTGLGHFSLQTPIPECMCTGQQLSAAHTTVLGRRESPLTCPSSLPTIDSLTAHPRVHVHRPTVVCSSHNCVWL